MSSNVNKSNGSTPNPSLFEKAWNSLPKESQTPALKVSLQKSFGIYEQPKYVKYTWAAKVGEPANEMIKVLRTSGKGTKYYSKGIPVSVIDAILGDAEEVLKVRQGPVSEARIGNSKDE